MAADIRFYGVKDAYGWCSNFSPSPIELEGARWPTVEHFFQAQKFRGTPHVEEIRAASSPVIAARMGRSDKRPLRADWEDVKDEVMRLALRAKFAQLPELGEKLLASGDARIVEHTDNDHYWADGGDGSGKNRLGELLMDVRDDLRRAREHVEAYRSVMKPGRSWVVFLLGTCVVVDVAIEDPAAHAREVLRAHGPVHAGTPSGDFNVHSMPGAFGWLIGFDHPDMMVRVAPQDPAPSDMTVGLIGRAARATDARLLSPVHTQVGDGD